MVIIRGIYGILLLMALMTAAVAGSSRASAQWFPQTAHDGFYGAGGYLERPEQDAAGTAAERKRRLMRRQGAPAEYQGEQGGQERATRRTRSRRENAEENEPRQRHVRTHRREDDAAVQKSGVTPPEAANTPKEAAAVPQETGVTPKAAAIAPQETGNTAKEAGVTPKDAGATPKAAAAAPQNTASLQTGDSLDKMIGQMVIVGFQGTTPDEPSVQKLAAQIKAGSAGGVLFLGHNIISPQQVTALTGYLRHANPDVPVLIAVDQEGGIVQRLSHDKGFPEFPSAGQVGKGNDPLDAYIVYQRMAAELVAYGFNLNLGPVVDLQRNDESLIIAGKERSFGAPPKHVAAFAKAFCIAHRDAGLLTALKHFPGHGSTKSDTHAEAADVSQSWSADELEPYRELIKAGVADIVMAGHITHRDMSDEPDLPASLSEKAITKLLRGELGFTGVIVTDDLEMAAVAKRFALEDSVIRAIKAGNNLVLVSNQSHPSLDLPERVVAAVRSAVESGALKREQIVASYERITALKQRLRSPNAMVSAKPDPAKATPAQ